MFTLGVDFLAASLPRIFKPGGILFVPRLQNLQSNENSVVDLRSINANAEQKGFQLSEKK